MLHCYGFQDGRLVPTDLKHAAQALWFDLEHPEPQDIAFVTREAGLSLPGHDDLAEIETSSRLYAEGDVLTLSLPIVTRVGAELQPSVCGFVVAPDRLITLRYAPSPLFEHFPAQPHHLGEPASAYLLAELLEAIAGRQADTLEGLRAALDKISHHIFHTRVALGKAPQRQRNEEAELQAILVTLGRDYDTISQLRDSLLGLARLIPYVLGTVLWLPEALHGRLNTVAKDVIALTEFCAHLTERVQFLLDSTLGLISIAQNGLIKVLTVASIIGIPPTLIAGIYGMNFINIPELHWTFGYAYAWGAMLLSAIAPLVWFRKKGWI